MKYSNWLLSVLLAFCLQGANAQNGRQWAIDNYERCIALTAKENVDDKTAEAIQRYREEFQKNPYRGYSLGKRRGEWKKYADLLSSNGSFIDLEKAAKKSPGEKIVADNIGEAFNRIWSISDAYRRGALDKKKDATLWKKCRKAILLYGEHEIRRPNTNARFLDSCFGIPMLAMNIYFCHLQDMDAVESGKVCDEQLKEVCDMLKTVALQAWTQPMRNDATDENVVQVDRFRNHVWWVGANGVAYRPVLPVAFMFRSAPMVNVIADVCQGAISYTSQNTFDDSFWIEGLTADGAGWGHGKQCLIWGYPIQGILSALGDLNFLKGSPWERKLDEQNVNALFNFFRGSVWYYYKGYIPPCLDRYSSVYNLKQGVIASLGLVNVLLQNWTDLFTREQLIELRQFKEEAMRQAVDMDCYPAGEYHGTRWFFNNDDFIKKNKDYYIFVNMASVRCDGMEGAAEFADRYNFYTCDGLTLFEKSGCEYKGVIGAWDVTRLPGITAREGMDQLMPATNWRGYCSKHNFATGVTRGGDCGATGFIFEKMNASDKENVNDRGDRRYKNSLIYGVKAYKSYFFIDDFMIALGAGVTNKDSELDGRIRTSVEQTLLESEIQEKTTDKDIHWWIQPGKFAYSVFPEYQKRTHFTAETKKNDWVNRNLTNKDKTDLPESTSIFSLWIDHGTKPVNDTYGYVVYAGNDDVPSEYPFKVLANDTLVQAVQNREGDVLEAIFYDPAASLKWKDNPVRVSSPCGLMIEEIGEQLFVTVSDALMDKDLNTIEVIVGSRRVSVSMPQGDQCGKPATITVSK